MERITNIEDYVTVRKISNRKDHTNVERFVCATKQKVDTTLKVFEIGFVVRSFVGNEEKTAEYRQKKSSILAHSGTRVLLRDEAGSPIPNPEYIPSETPQDDSDYDKNLWVDGWTFVGMLINNPIVVAEKIGEYILINDFDGFYD